jgi:hypothetical protein
VRVTGFGPSGLIFVLLFGMSFLLVPACRTLGVLSFEYFPLPDDVSFVSQLPLIVGALVLFLFGYIKGGASAGGSEVGRRLQLDIVFYLHSVFLFVGAAACAALIVRADADLWSYFLYQNYFRLEVNNDVGYIKGLINLSTASGLLLYLACSQSGKVGIFNWMLLMLAFLMNLVFAHRFVAVGFLVSLAFAHHVFFKRMGWWSVLKFLAFLLIFNAVYANFRDVMHAEVSNSIELHDVGAQGVDALGFAVASFLSFQFHGLTSLLEVERLVEEGALVFHYGWHYVYDIVFSVVPYSAYPEKFPPIGTVFNMRLRGDYGDVYDPQAEVAGGIVLGYVGDLYYFGGLAGVLLGSFVFGWFLRKVDLSLVGRLGRGAFFMAVVILPYCVLSVQGVGGLLPRATIVACFSWFLLWIVSTDKVFTPSASKDFSET